MMNIPVQISVLCLLYGMLLPGASLAFVVAPQVQSRSTFICSPQKYFDTRRWMSSSGYVPPVPEGTVASKKKKSLHPSVGDIVRFYDLDGGKVDGQVLVGRISYIQKNLGNEGSGWLVEIAELDDVGSGFYADYPMQKRSRKRTMRDLADVSPIAASFVRTEDAFKVPIDSKTGNPIVRAESYDIEDYPGPFAGANAINQEIVQADGEVYGALKSKLLRYSAIAGLAGAVVVDLAKGSEDALIYFGGVLASLFYLFFLTVKTDTVASQDAKLGSDVANLRFVAPLLVLVGVAFYNKSRGDENPVLGQGPFDTVTAEQFASAILGFLTYRIPLFFTQIQDAFKDDQGDMILPGSAGVAIQLAKKESEKEIAALTADSLVTVLLVSGPQATGRSELVRRLVEEGNGQFVLPKMVDNVKDPVMFERLKNRDEFLSYDHSGRYGLTKEGIFETARGCGPDSVVVVDATTDLAKRLSSLAGLRLIGVWVGYNKVEDFELSIAKQIDSGLITIPEDETRESVIRARIRDIVQEIEFGISSGIFEFTIINEDGDASLKQLREAASYCFK
jgi:hypothetical protein